MTGCHVWDIESVGAQHNELEGRLMVADWSPALKRTRILALSLGQSCVSLTCLKD